MINWEVTETKGKHLHNRSRSTDQDQRIKINVSRSTDPDQQIKINKSRSTNQEKLQNIFIKTFKKARIYFNGTEEVLHCIVTHSSFRDQSLSGKKDLNILALPKR